ADEAITPITSQLRGILSGSGPPTVDGEGLAEGRNANCVHRESVASFAVMELKRQSVRMQIQSSVLLCALLALILTVPLGDFGGGLRIAVDVFYFTVFCIGGYLLSPTKAWLKAYIILAIPILLAGIVCAFNNEVQILVVTSHFLSLGLQFLLIDAVVRFSLFNSAANEIDRILAGICGYLILGLFWANIFTIYENLAPGGFLRSDGSTISTEDGSVLYFSLVTLSTLGYGDITPNGPWPRMLAALEAVAGTLYLTVFIAALVSNLRNSKKD
ncbi:MAG: potassium channel family protein, partial [Verrucomicrobiales bacterium]